MSKEIITFQVSDSLLEKLNESAKKLDVSRSDIIRMAIREYLSLLEKSVHQEYGRFL
jgi:metal-responsive CopG/Arc/MetJ family transcriptional regulator